MYTAPKTVTVIFAGGNEDNAITKEHEGKRRSLLSNHKNIKEVITNLGFYGDCKFTARRLNKNNPTEKDIEELAHAVEISPTPWVIVLSDTRDMERDSHMLEEKLADHLGKSGKVVIMTGASTPLAQEEVLGTRPLPAGTTTDGYENLKSALEKKHDHKEAGLYVVTDRGKWYAPDELKVRPISWWSAFIQSKDREALLKEEKRVTSNSNKRSSIIKGGVLGPRR